MPDISYVASQGPLTWTHDIFTDTTSACGDIEYIGGYANGDADDSLMAYDPSTRTFSIETILNSDAGTYNLEFEAVLIRNPTLYPSKKIFVDLVVQVCTA